MRDRQVYERSRPSNQVGREAKRLHRATSRPSLNALSARGTMATAKLTPLVEMPGQVAPRS